MVRKNIFVSLTYSEVVMPMATVGLVVRTPGVDGCQVKMSHVTIFERDCSADSIWHNPKSTPGTA